MPESDNHESSDPKDPMDDEELILGDDIELGADPEEGSGEAGNVPGDLAGETGEKVDSLVGGEDEDLELEDEIELADDEPHGGGDDEDLVLDSVIPLSEVAADLGMSTGELESVCAQHGIGYIPQGGTERNIYDDDMGILREAIRAAGAEEESDGDPETTEPSEEGDKHPDDEEAADQTRGIGENIRNAVRTARNKISAALGAGAGAVGAGMSTFTAGLGAVTRAAKEKAKGAVATGAGALATGMGTVTSAAKKKVKGAFAWKTEKGAAEESPVDPKDAAGTAAPLTPTGEISSSSEAPSSDPAQGQEEARPKSTMNRRAWFGSVSKKTAGVAAAAVAGTAAVGGLGLVAFKGCDKEGNKYSDEELAAMQSQNLTPEDFSEGDVPAGEVNDVISEAWRIARGGMPWSDNKKKVKEMLKEAYDSLHNRGKYHPSRNPNRSSEYSWPGRVVSLGGRNAPEWVVRPFFLHGAIKLLSGRINQAIKDVREYEKIRKSLPGEVIRLRKMEKETDKRTGEKGTGEKKAGEKEAGEKEAGEKEAGEKKAGEKEAGEGIDIDMQALYQMRRKVADLSKGIIDLEDKGVRKRSEDGEKNKLMWLKRAAVATEILSIFADLAMFYSLRPGLGAAYRLEGTAIRGMTNDSPYAAARIFEHLMVTHNLMPTADYNKEIGDTPILPEIIRRRFLTALLIGGGALYVGPKVASYMDEVTPRHAPQPSSNSGSGVNQQSQPATEATKSGGTTDSVEPGMQVEAGSQSAAEYQKAVSKSQSRLQKRFEEEERRRKEEEERSRKEEERRRKEKEN